MDIRPGAILGQGLRTDGKQHPFQVSTEQRRRTATWQQLCGPHLCTNIQMHTFPPVLSGWAHSPPLGPKSDKSTHMVDKNTQSHSRLQTHTQLHTQLWSVFLRHMDAYGTNRLVFFRHSYTVNLSYTQIWLALGQDSLLQPSYMQISWDVGIHRGHMPPTVLSPYTPNCTHYCQSQVTVLSVVKCKHKHQFSCADLVRMLLQSHPKPHQLHTHRCPFALKHATGAYRHSISVNI